MNDDLDSLLRAIAIGDSANALRLLEHSAPLATQALPHGATRTSSTAFFLEAIQHHVYAGDTALHVASAAHSVELAKALVERDASVSASNRRGAQPLHYAADGHPTLKTWKPEAQAAIITYLLESGADANAVDKSGVAPLHRAVRTRSAAAVNALLNNGADVRKRNGSGSTPLQLALQNTGRGGSGTPEAKAQQAEIIRLLRLR